MVHFCQEAISEPICPERRTAFAKSLVICSLLVAAGHLILKGSQADIPVILVQPATQTCPVGREITMRVLVRGANPLLYQWQFQGTNLSGATNAVLSLPHVQFTNSGVYSVSVSNRFARTVSSNAVLNVGPAFVTTQSAFITSPGTATLHGTITPGEREAVAWFEWGTNFANAGVAGSIILLPTAGIVPIQASLSALKASEAIYYRTVVSNVFGVVRGAVQAFTPNGQVTAWGASADLPSDLSNVVAIACGESHDLALINDGSVKAWGENAGSGQANAPPRLTNAVAISAGANFSLALKNDGAVVMWGEGGAGQTNVPPGVTNVLAIATGSYHALALKRDGTVVAWGADSAGQVDVPRGLSNVVAIAAGAFYSLALRDDGTVLAWSDDSSGQTAVPANLGNVVAIAAGAYHGLALNRFGNVFAWGANDDHQSEIPGNLNNVLAIAAKEGESLALLNPGTVLAWGNNEFGQTNVPMSLTRAIAIAAGPDHNLALTVANASGSESVQLELSADRLVWTRGVLQSAAKVTGPYRDLTNAISPYPWTRSLSEEFYRLNLR